MKVTKLALFMQLKAKAGKEEEVAAFLKGAAALLEQEPLTVAWFAVRFDQSTFGIFDAFDSDQGRQAHLSGSIAAALRAKYDELFEGPLEIKQPDVLADRLPG
ncbi:putative quinol monooxygenase [Rhizobium ruizarguesonis]|jgi:quinol monooxygenase YgiN|uniref:putative quinol monooxygenase n=1 Tax=Rhizobium ruizarguesonis TaxID=2081791 RepID=UPI000372BE87